jgi:SEC-C motif domain protein
MEIRCPCSSGLLYSLCCARYHRGAICESAEHLMRSRFSAYALGRDCAPLADYIIETTHPENAQYEKNREKWKKSILLFSRETQFLQLEVFQCHEEHDVATVKFRAHLTQNYIDVSFTEKSTFKKINNRWLYLSGEIEH